VSRPRSSGFALIAAIFLLVVVAGLVEYITHIGVVQQTTVVCGLQGARAIQEARCGIEWAYTSRR
jgi:MSHA biogenesis protein MshP